MIADEFKNLPDQTRRWALHLAIDCNGRLGNSGKYDSIRYEHGMKLKGSYPVSLMEVIVEKARKKI